MELFVKCMIYIHAFMGGIGLLSGLITVAVKKGGKLHRKLGKVFTVGMGISSLLSLIIAVMPKHENTFLFLIGIFTIYMLISGNRSIKYKKMDADMRIPLDKIVSVSMLVGSVVMVALFVYCYINKLGNGVLFLFFGLLSGLMAWKDWKFYNTPALWKKKWLSNHIGKMVGALIASITAFMVAGLSIHTLSAWIWPSIIGTFFIIYWIRKTKPKEKIATTAN
ncbi:MAG: hypothetical protein DI598_05075 [Pseudopedobacter saltans]|uniref:DUF2306 domain-containing protein n=1 Tax=Pseudopedobacter saltans TaxID=151895 RepID=A0A2W5F783_9SPHI|nr:MAG: hypothetical protein DI598_05075 [Pseudopedobacter saltans]